MSIVSELQQRWPLPSNPRPIVIIGAGDIVNDAHLPAYRLGDFSVTGIYDIDAERSGKTAAAFAIPNVYTALENAVAADGVVFDIAVPPDRLLGILEQLPDSSTVLMQKPMGTNIEDARAIRKLCRERKFTAAVNFQLRFSPMMLALRDLVQRDLIGDIVDVEFHLSYREPWELFPFLKKQPRVEMMIASIHYFDWIRSLLGDPEGVYARSIPHPRFPDIETTRTSAILDYGNKTRCCLSLNNTWAFGPKHETTTVRIEGLKGAAMLQLGALINYPEGEPDTLEFITEGGDWTAVSLVGNWFPDAFLGTMSNLQRFAAGEDDELRTGVEDAFRTMALIEACYTSNGSGATPVVDS